MFKKILLAADGSPHSFRAAEKAMAIVKENSTSTIDVVYVIDGTKAKSDALKHSDKYTVEAERKAKLRPIEEMFTNEDVTYQVHFIRGEPGPSIIKYANEQPFDLVVIGSRGLNSLQGMVLGSVSHKIAKRVNCPVMIVK